MQSSKQMTEKTIALLWIHARPNKVGLQSDIKKINWRAKMSHLWLETYIDRQ